MKLTTGMLFIGLMLSFAAQGASFDCAKATTNLEKQICGNPAISKLDDEIGKLYQNALDKADEEQKQRLVTEQKHWLRHTRNTCKDEPCIKLAYWARQAELATFFDPKPPLYKHESEKANAIKQMLATVQLKPSESNYDKRFCGQFFDDLKQMKGIRFVDPVVQALSYEDPALDKWKRNCGTKPPLHFSYSCLKNVVDNVHSYTDAMETPGCFKGFGVPPLKIYQLPPIKQGGKKRYIFYADNAYGSAGGGFQQIDTEKCGHVTGVFFIGGTESRAGNHNNIINYSSQYYFVGLYRAPMITSEGNFSQWVLKAETVAPNGTKGKQSCSWSSALTPDSSTQGSK